MILGESFKSKVLNSRGKIRVIYGRPDVCGIRITGVVIPVPCVAGGGLAVGHLLTPDDHVVFNLTDSPVSVESNVISNDGRGAECESFRAFRIPVPAFESISRNVCRRSSGSGRCCLSLLNEDRRGIADVYFLHACYMASVGIEMDPVSCLDYGIVRSVSGCGNASVNCVVVGADLGLVLSLGPACMVLRSKLGSVGRKAAERIRAVLRNTYAREDVVVLIAESKIDIIAEHGVYFYCSVSGDSLNDVGSVAVKGDGLRLAFDEPSGKLGSVRI